MNNQRRNLSQEETVKFIEIWRYCVMNVPKKRRKYPLYLELQKRFFEEESVKMKPLQIKNKINNLIQRYRLEKKKIESSGGIPSTWEYYKAVDTVIGLFPSNSPSSKVKSTMKDDEVLAVPLPKFIFPASASEPTSTVQLPSPINISSSSSSNITSPSSRNIPSSPAKTLDRISKIMEEELEIVKKDSETYRENSSKEFQFSREIVALLKESNDLIRQLIKQNK